MRDPDESRGAPWSRRQIMLERHQDRLRQSHHDRLATVGRNHMSGRAGGHRCGDRRAARGSRRRADRGPRRPRPRRRPARPLAAAASRPSTDGRSSSCAMSAATTCTSSRKRPPRGSASAASPRSPCTRPTTICPSGRRRTITSLPGGDTYGSQLLHIPVALGVWAVGAAAGSGRVADTGRDLLRAQIAVVSWTYAIKVATDRTRPNGDPQSFPSGHASTSFATAMVLQEHFGWKAGVPAFAAAAYTAVSRVAANQHWASDVVFGAAVGLASGRTVTIQLREARLRLAPLAVPGGGGVLVTAVR